MRVSEISPIRGPFAVPNTTAPPDGSASPTTTPPETLLPPLSETHMYVVRELAPSGLSTTFG